MIDIISQFAFTGNDPDSEKKSISEADSIVQRIMDNGSDKKRLSRILSDMKSATVNGARSAAQTTQNAVVKTKHLSLWLVARFPILILLVVGLVMYGPIIIPGIYSSIVSISTFAESFLHPITLIWIANLLTLMIVLTFFVYFWPSDRLENKNKFFMTELWIIGIFILFSLGYSTFVLSPDSDVNLQEVTDQTTGGLASIWNTFTCSIDIRPGGCIENLATEQQGTTTPTIEYKINVEKSPSFTKTVSLEDLNDDEIIFYHEFLAEEGITIVEHRCYHTSVKDENLFYTNEDIIDIEVRGSGFIPIVPGGLECQNRGAIPLEPITRQELRIYSVLEFTVDTTLSQEIPAVSMEKFLESIGETDQGYTRNDLKSELDKLVSSQDKKLIYPDLFKSASTFGLGSSLPTLHGDGDDEPITLTLSIEKDPISSRFAKFVAGQITGIDLPHTLRLKSEEQDFTDEIKFGLDNKYETTIRLVEDDGADLSIPVTKQDLRIDVLATFERVDHVDLIVELTTAQAQALRNVQNEFGEGTSETVEEINNIIGSDECPVIGGTPTCLEDPQETADTGETPTEGTGNEETTSETQTTTEETSEEPVIGSDECPIINGIPQC